MRAPAGKRSRSLGFNMTPMIDVVFLLIIFFLVSSHLAKQEVQLELDLPQAESGNEPLESRTPRVTVNVLPSGEAQLAGEPVGIGELSRRLEQERNQAGRDLEVRIRADRGAPYRFVEPVLLSCAQAGIWNVTFAVLRE